MSNGRKIILGHIALTMCMVSVILAFGFIGFGLYSAQARQQDYTATAQDFNIPSSVDPWGTTFDNKGQIWLAIPGCDPAPTCNPNDPPGEIAEFNPSSSSWINTYHLPSGYAQPLFLAFDSQGKLCFPLPMGNSIGMFDPSTNTFQQWPVPTANAGPWDVAIDGTGIEQPAIWYRERFFQQLMVHRK